MQAPDYNIEIAVDGGDQMVVIKPPVDNAFREQVYDVLEGMGLMREIVIRDGSFFETKHLPDGSPYSELRISSTALSVVNQRAINIAHESARILRDQRNKVEVSPYLIAAGGTQRLFGRNARDS